MMKTVTFLLTVLVSGSSQQCFSSNDTAPIIGSDKTNGWATSRHEFSLSLFKHLNKADNHANVIFSPSSVYELLLLAYFGAAHETEKSLAKVLQLGGFLKKAETWRIYQSQRLITSEQDMKTYPLKTANKLFFSNKLTLRSCVRENLKKEIEMIDYQTNAQWATSYINKWVEDVTEGEIKDFFDTLSPASTVTLVNAVLFKAKWLNEFEPRYTRDLPFHVNSKITKTTSMLMRRDDFFVGRHVDIDARVLFLPYKSERQVMIILLPDNDVDKTMELLDGNVLQEISKGRHLKMLYVEVMIPKFNESNEIPLNAPLGKLGIGNAISGNADYSRFTGKAEVSFTEVKQKAMIQVDEEGTKAAAVTGGIPRLAAKTPSERFVCDRPFAYYIYDSFTETILFMGTFRHPK